MILINIVPEVLASTIWQEKVKNKIGKGRNETSHFSFFEKSQTQRNREQNVVYQGLQGGKNGYTPVKGYKLSVIGVINLGI